jgi:hypothetical protein
MNGVGNDFIINSLIDYFIKNKHLRDKSLVVIGLTSHSRLEFLRKNSEEVFYTNLSSWKEKEFVKNFFEERFNERFYYLKFLRKIILLQSLLKNWNISYIMFEALDNGHQSFKNDLEVLNLLNEIDISRTFKLFEGSFFDFVNTDNQNKDGHPNHIGHKEMAELLYEFIIKNRD